MASTVPIVIVILVASSFSLGASQNTCVPRNFGYDSVVCVCNSSYCDSTPRFVPHKGQYAFYQTSQSGQRLDRTIGNLENHTENTCRSAMTSVTFRPHDKYQTMHGFGGAFTDAAGINIMRMSQKSQQNIMKSYFGDNGSRYSLGRVPIGGTDFSTRPYTYDDHDGDIYLNKFALPPEDYRYKIPLMKEARLLSPRLRFVSAAWSAPAWMKTDDDISGFGYLKESYYQPFAEYLTRFLEEYRSQGLDIWAISTGNEPSRIFEPANDYNSMGWTAPGMARFVARNLAPTIARSRSNNTVILILDDQRWAIPAAVVDVYRNIAAYNATAGIAIHWYADDLVTTVALDITHQLYPDRFLLVTEGCVGEPPQYSTPVELGDWGRAETYVLDLIGNFQHWVTGFVDWNLVLDTQGGPNYAHNFVDSPIIVNPKTDEIYKQPTYYALAHFSKFIPPGSMRIGTNNTNYEDGVAFLTPENEIVLVMYNRKAYKLKVRVTDPEQGHTCIEMLPHSIGTMIYKR